MELVEQLGDLGQDDQGSQRLCLECVHRPCIRILVNFVFNSPEKSTIKNNYNPEWEFTAKFNIKKEVTEFLMMIL